MQNERRDRITSYASGGRLLRAVGRVMITAVLGTVLTLATAAAANAAPTVISWDPNPEPNIAGYYVYYGNAPRQYAASVYVGNTTSYTFNNLAPGMAYYFAIQAVNTSGSGSGWSDEISSSTIAFANFDGDSRSDVATFRRSTGQWLVRTSLLGNNLSVSWGQGTDVPFTGDVDGDGTSDLTMFTPSSGYWSTLYSASGYNRARATYVSWGATGDVPVMADFDGDGRSDYAVFRPAAGRWFIRHATGAQASYAWGMSGDIPLTGDFDGDKRADLGVFRPSDGRWYLALSSTGYQSYLSINWGAAGDKPLVGDFDGDGLSDAAIFRPSTGYWYIWYSAGNFQWANWITAVWGVSTDQPVTGDYDGDGKADIGVYRASEGRWHFLYSSTGFRSGTTVVWGLAGDDVPLAR